MKPHHNYATKISKNTRAQVLWEMSVAFTLILALLLYAINL